MSISCQDFKEGCCGCCINMGWSKERIERYMSVNTELVDRVLEKRDGKLRMRDLVCIHLRCGGLADYLLALIFVPLTFGLSALLWKSIFGSCCFAGYLNQEKGRVGCLIHPLRVGGDKDLRRHAFPLVPTLRCDRELRCPQLDDPQIPLETGWYDASKKGAESLGRVNDKH